MTILERLFEHARSRLALTYLAGGLLLVIAIVIAGENIARHISAIEAWLAQLGPWGIAAFIALLVVATSLMLPEAALAIMAGALFGLTLGLAAVITGNLLAATLQYGLSRRLLQGPIDRALATRPALAAIQSAVMRDELKLQTLLRLTPLNPATVSYMLGAAGVKFPGFLLACLAMLPTLLIEVYIGYVGKHAAHMAVRSTGAVLIHDMFVFGGLAVTVLVMALIARTAHKAVMQAVSEAASDAKK